MATELLESQLEVQWANARDFIAERWNKLTAEDIRQINGNFDTFISKLQARYGYSRAEAANQIEKWLADNKIRISGSDRPYVRPVRQEEYRASRSESPSLLKWILGIGIPLLLLASWFGYENSKTTFPAERSATVTTQFTGDQMMLDNIRAAFVNNNFRIASYPNVTINASNGVVTLSGNVPTAQDRTAINNIVRSSAGVRDVVNNIEVR